MAVYILYSSAYHRIKANYQLNGVDECAVES